MITVELDPRHQLPPVKGVEYASPDYDVVEDYSTVPSIQVSLDELLVGSTGTTSPGLRPPESVVVISQTTRMSSSGQTVVDVLLEILDAPGAEEYEVRMAVG